MALLERLRALLRRPVSASRVGARRPTSGGRRGDTVHEDALRASLGDDPNNESAFQALAEVVRRRAAETVPHPDDPLTAAVVEQERERAANLAVWSLAEELAGNPRAWYPLLELARLSVGDDVDGALRRLATAAERDPSGRALAAGIELLRQVGRPAEGLNLGVGHSRLKEQIPQVGAQMVLASLDAGRPEDARLYLSVLVDHPDRRALSDVLPGLEDRVSAAGQTSPQS